MTDLEKRTIQHFIDFVVQLGWRYKLSDDRSFTMYVWKGDKCNIDSLRIMTFEFGWFGSEFVTVYYCLTNKTMSLSLSDYEDCVQGTTSIQGITGTNWIKFAEALNG